MLSLYELFELKHITEEEAVKDYEKLCKVQTDNDRILTGNKAMDYFFFEYRIRTKTARGVSFPEWYKTDEHLKPYYTKLIGNKIVAGCNVIRAKYDAWRLYNGSGTISAFKPIIAKKLYKLYNPKTILDFCSGWGGRCLGAMALDKNYIGIDTNTSLKSAYDDMIDLYPTAGKIEMIYRDSAQINYADYVYDMVFTSPPYFTKSKPTEQYEGMPEYKNRDDFNERFLFPVIKNTYTNLQPRGVYALNLPTEMYLDIIPILGECNEKFPLTLSSRGKSEKRLGSKYQEYIYIWFKPPEPIYGNTILSNFLKNKGCPALNVICKKEKGSSVAKSNTLLSVLASTLRSSSKVSYSFWLAVFQNERVSMLFLIVGLSFIYRCVVMATLVK